MQPEKGLISAEDDYSKHCSPGTAVSSGRVVMSNGIDLKTVSFTPQSGKDLPPVIFVPGMASIVDNFTGTLTGLTKDFVVHFIETREKTSSRLPANTTFEVREIAGDISGVIGNLIPEKEDYILVTYSLGATAAAESFNSILQKKPRLFVMIEPSGTFRVPKIGIFIAANLAWMYKIVKPFIKFYIRRFLINTKDDYDMHLIIMRILDTADPYKLAPTLVAASGYSLWSSLEKVDVPTLVIGASKDTFHNLNDAMEISSHIRGSEYIDLETNKRTHSSEVAECILKIFNNLSRAF